MTVRASALYSGAVVHERLRPRFHRFRYRAFWVLFDLDELPELGRSLRLFSYNRVNLFSFHDRDHGDGSSAPLRFWIETHLREAEIDIGGGAIRLFCLPRMLGYAFNPISLFFCHRRDGSLAAILYQVNNTFGERHSYLLPVDPAQGARIRQGCAKRLYVSPFMDMAMSYDFRVGAPARTIDVTIDGSDGDGLVIKTALHGKRRPLDDRSLAGSLVALPLLTLKVIAAIHWEALRLWVKGVKLTKRPPKPEFPVTYGPARDR
jgi:DUF1365 family protein